MTQDENRSVSGKNENGMGMKVTNTIKNVILFLIVAISIIPIMWMIFISFKTNSDIFLKPFALPIPIQWINYKNAFDVVPYSLMLKNTGKELFWTIPLSLFISFISSFAIAKIPCGKVNDSLLAVYMAGIIVPGFVLMFPIYVICNWLGIYDTVLSLGLVHVAWSAPLNTMLLVTMMRDVPSSLQEAAVIDGCNLRKIMFRVYWPLVKPTMITLLILLFLSVWNDFAIAKVLLLSNENRTIPLAVTLFKSRYDTDYAMMSAGILILVIPQAAVFTSLQKYIIDGIMAGAVKG